MRPAALKQVGHNPAHDKYSRPYAAFTAWSTLTTGELYRDLGGEYFQRRDPERTTRRLIAQLEALGNHVTLQEAQLAA